MKYKTKICLCTIYVHTLESGIAPGTFDKNNKHSPLNKRSPPKINFLRIAKGKKGSKD